MKIALLNSVIMNGGDAGIIYGTIDAILNFYPDVEIVVYAHKAHQASRYYPDLDIRPMLNDRWPVGRYAEALMRKTYPVRSRLGLLFSSENSFYRELREFDLVVYCGGGYINNLYSTGPLFAMMKKTLSLGIPHMAYAHSIGPFFKSASHVIASELLNKFGVVTVRDQASYNLVKQFVASTDNLFFTADAAFAMLPSADAVSREQRVEVKSILKFKAAADHNPLLFISVRQWKFPGCDDAKSLSDAYLKELIRFFFRVLNETKWRICFISTCQGRGNYGFDDASFAQMLVNDLPEVIQQRIHVTHTGFHPRFYPELISTCADMVITMRMHFMIYSIIAKVPVIPIAYEQKSTELANQIGLDDYCHEVAKLNADHLFNSFVVMQENNEKIRKKIKNGYEVLKTRSLENSRILNRYLVLAESN